MAATSSPITDVIVDAYNILLNVVSGFTIKPVAYDPEIKRDIADSRRSVLTYKALECIEQLKFDVKYAIEHYETKGWQLKIVSSLRSLDYRGEVNKTTEWDPFAIGGQSDDYNVQEPSYLENSLLHEINNAFNNLTTIIISLIDLSEMSNLRIDNSTRTDGLARLDDILGRLNSFVHYSKAKLTSSATPPPSPPSPLPPLNNNIRESKLEIGSDSKLPIINTPIVRSSLSSQPLKSILKKRDAQSSSSSSSAPSILSPPRLPPPPQPKREEHKPVEVTSRPYKDVLKEQFDAKFGGDKIDLFDKLLKIELIKEARSKVWRTASKDGIVDNRTLFNYARDGVEVLSHFVELCKEESSKSEEDPKKSTKEVFDSYLDGAIGVSLTMLVKLARYCILITHHSAVANSSHVLDVSLFDSRDVMRHKSLINEDGVIGKIKKIDKSNSTTYKNEIEFIPWPGGKVDGRFTLEERLFDCIETVKMEDERLFGDIEIRHKSKTDQLAIDMFKLTESIQTTINKIDQYCYLMTCFLCREIDALDLNAINSTFHYTIYDNYGAIDRIVTQPDKTDIGIKCDLNWIVVLEELSGSKSKIQMSQAYYMGVFSQAIALKLENRIITKIDLQRVDMMMQVLWLLKHVCITKASLQIDNNEPSYVGSILSYERLFMALGSFIAEYGHYPLYTASMELPMIEPIDYADKKETAKNIQKLKDVYGSKMLLAAGDAKPLITAMGDLCIRIISRSRITNPTSANAAKFLETLKYFGLVKILACRYNSLDIVTRSDIKKTPYIHLIAPYIPLIMEAAGYVPVIENSGDLLSESLLMVLEAKMINGAKQADHDYASGKHKLFVSIKNEIKNISPQHSKFACTADLKLICTPKIPKIMDEAKAEAAVAKEKSAKKKAEVKSKTGPRTGLFWQHQKLTDNKSYVHCNKIELAYSRKIPSTCTMKLIGDKEDLDNLTAGSEWMYYGTNSTEIEVVIGAGLWESSDNEAGTNKTITMLYDDEWTPNKPFKAKKPNSYYSYASEIDDDDLKLIPMYFNQQFLCDKLSDVDNIEASINNVFTEVGYGNLTAPQGEDTQDIDRFLSMLFILFRCPDSKDAAILAAGCCFTGYYLQSSLMLRISELIKCRSSTLAYIQNKSYEPEIPKELKTKTSPECIAIIKLLDRVVFLKSGIQTKDIADEVTTFNKYVIENLFGIANDDWKQQKEYKTVSEKINEWKREDPFVAELNDKSVTDGVYNMYAKWYTIAERRKKHSNEKGSTSDMYNSAVAYMKSFGDIIGGVNGLERKDTKESVDKWREFIVNPSFKAACEIIPKKELNHQGDVESSHFKTDEGKHTLDYLKGVDVITSSEDFVYYNELDRQLTKYYLPVFANLEATLRNIMFIKDSVKLNLAVVIRGLLMSAMNYRCLYYIMLRRSTIDNCDRMVRLYDKTRIEYDDYKKKYDGVNWPELGHIQRTSATEIQEMDMKSNYTALDSTIEKKDLVDIVKNLFIVRHEYELSILTMLLRMATAVIITNMTGRNPDDDYSFGRHTDVHTDHSSPPPTLVSQQIHLYGIASDSIEIFKVICRLLCSAIKDLKKVKKKDGIKTKEKDILKASYNLFAVASGMQLNKKSISKAKRLITPEMDNEYSYGAGFILLSLIYANVHKKSTVIDEEETEDEEVGIEDTTIPI